ncbi:MAG: hypothetical protein AAB362_02640 [Patescibacteria group bacterium]
MRAFFFIILAVFISTLLAGVFAPSTRAAEINWNDPSFTDSLRNPDGTIFIFGQGSSGDPFYETVGTPEPQKVTGFLGRLFVFLIGLVGVSAFFMIVWGGFQYATSSANPASMSAAKEKIWGALLGLALAAGSVIILQTINPDLIEFNTGATGPRNTNSIISALSQQNILY